MAKKNSGGGGGSSLQDQLRKVGLVSEKQLKKAQNGLHRKDIREKHGEVDENKQLAAQARAEKLARDQKMMAEKNQLARDKALGSQIKQLIEMNSQHQKGDVGYKFTDQGMVKNVYVSVENKTQLNRGYLAIVKGPQGYDMVPEQVARRIMARQDGVVLYLFDRDKQAVDEDDPYKDFQIPDDLEW
jgi:uncharacterized protein YaiL (DUF2058 family)